MIFAGPGVLDADKPFVQFDNALDRATFSGTSFVAGFNWENIKGPQTFDAWQPVAGDGNVSFTLPAPETCDAFSVAAHNLATLGVSFVLQVSADLVASWATVASISGGDLAENGSEAITYLFAAQTVQRARILTFPVAAIPPIIGVAFLGRRLVFPGWVQPPYVPMPEAKTVDFKSSVSIGGHFLGGTVQVRGLLQDVQLAGLPRSFVGGAEFKAFSRHYRNGGAFFWGGSPSYMPADVGYCWRGDGGELRPAYIGGGRFADLKMGLAGYGA